MMLLPQQRCRIDGHFDARPAIAQDNEQAIRRPLHELIQLQHRRRARSQPAQSSQPTGTDVAVSLSFSAFWLLFAFGLARWATQP